MLVAGIPPPISPPRRHDALDHAAHARRWRTLSPVRDDKTRRIALVSDECATARSESDASRDSGSLTPGSCDGFVESPGKSRPTLERRRTRRRGRALDAVVPAGVADVGGGDSRARVRWLLRHPRVTDELAPGEVACVECRAARAVRACDGCHDSFCELCFVALHASGSRVRHAWNPIGRAVRASVIAIQRAFRGHMIRMQFRPLRMQYRARLHRMSVEITLEMIDDVISSELIPEVLLEVFSAAAGDEFDGSDALRAVSQDVASAIILDVVERSIFELAAGEIGLLVREYVAHAVAAAGPPARDRDGRRYIAEAAARHSSLNPLVAAAEDVIAEAVVVAAREAADLALHECVSEYMDLQRFEGIHLSFVEFRGLSLSLSLFITTGARHLVWLVFWTCFGLV